MSEPSRESSAPSSLSLPPVLASKYRMTRRLGEGGMGIVYAGEHVELHTRVAIKVLQPSLEGDQNARARFMREARTAASIEGDHSTRLFDVGEDDQGRCYMVMEYLAGETADVRLKRQERMSVADAATILVHLLDALAEAHAKGLVHRDLKPANIFLVDKQGEAIWAKVLDFGISKSTSPKHLDRPSLTLTAPRTLLGSPDYMSPEQLRDSASVGTSADIWACGVILFELLTGKMPFDAASLPDLCAKVLAEPPRSFTAAGLTDVPEGLQRLVSQCLEKSPEARPKNAYQLATVLAPFAHASAQALLPRIRAQCGDGGLEAPREGKPARRVVAGLVLVALSGALAFTLASLRAEPVQTTHITAAAAPSLLPAPEAPPAPATLASAVVVPEPPREVVAAPSPSPSANLPPAPPRTTSKTTPRPKKPTNGSIKDLDGIDLIH